MVKRKVTRKKAPRRASVRVQPMKKGMQCSCNGKHKILIGIVLLFISTMLYLGYGWMEIFGILGILAILKGFFMHRNC